MKKYTSTIILTLMLSFITSKAWAGDGLIDYTVEKKDCISKIARRFHQPAELIAAVNNISMDRTIRIGDKLQIPIDPFESSDYQNEEEFIVSKAVPAAVAVVRAHHKPALKISYRGFDKILWPLNGEITSGYGSRWGGEFHHGLDIAADYGTMIYAAAEGKVVQAGYKNHIYGNAVMIDNGTYTFLYGHASVVLVEEGQDVLAGEAIARVGSSGRSTGPHLHFEVRTGDETINPLRLLP